jgi:hypothetical protein
MPTTLLHLSDSQSGQLGGLIAPGTELEYDNNEKRTPELSATSLWVWDCYNKVIDTAIDYTGTDPLVVYHTSEVVHGSRFIEYLYSSWQEHQVTIAVQALSHLRRIPTLAGIRFCYGTGAHDYGQQSATKGVAERCAAWGYPVACVDHGVEEIDGCSIDWAHHGPTVSRMEDKACAGRRYVIRLLRLFLERGKRAPDIVLRGHVHARITEMVKVPWGRDGVPVLLSIGAPLAGMNEYAHKFTQSTPITEIGGTLIRIENGRVLDFQGVTFERENRQRVDGVVAHPYEGSPRK